jgi:hypothetical protein
MTHAGSLRALCGFFLATSAVQGFSYFYRKEQETLIAKYAKKKPQSTQKDSNQVR